MATTPGGNPYPLGTDHVVDGDDAIHALALKLDTVYTHQAPVWAAGAPVPLATTSDLRWVHHGYRVFGALECAAASVAAAGVWKFTLPFPAKFPNAAPVVILGNGFVYNNVPVVGCSLIAHTADAGLKAWLYTEGSGLGGFGPAVAAGALIEVVFDYETTVIA